MKYLRDGIEINAPSVIALGTVTLADLKTLAAVAAYVVSIICTILITRHKLNRKD